MRQGNSRVKGITLRNMQQITRGTSHHRWQLLKTLCSLACLVSVLCYGGCSKQTVQDDTWVRTPDDQPRAVTHEVAMGESLTMIADNYYGDPALSAKIAQQNGLQDPERLEAGSVLVLQFDQQEWQMAQKRSAAMGPYNRGVDLLAQGDLTGAEREFRLALDIAPQFVNARYNLALVLGKRGQLEKADSILVDLLAERPNDTDFFFAMGNIQFQQARFEDAAATFQEVLTLAAGDRRAAFGLARSLQEAGQTSQAVAAWQDYLELDSTSSWADAARRNLAQLQAQPN